MTSPIAYLCTDPGIAPDGDKGASVHFRALAAALGRLGLRLDVVMTRPGSLAAFAPHGGEVVPTPRGSGFTGEVLQLGHAAAVRAVLARRGPHAAVYERLSLFGLAGAAYAHDLGLPHVVEVNAPLWREAAAYRGLGLAATARGLALDVLGRAARVFAVSAALRDELLELGVEPSRVEVLGNGADLASFRGAVPAARPAALQGRPTLLFCGSLKPWHGIGFLLQAFAALRARRDCALWVVGDGPERDRLAAFARHYPADVVVEGAVEHARIPGLLAAADLVVAPYTNAAPGYFSPLKVVEALAAGRPLLASRVPCVLAAVAGHPMPGLFAADDVGDFVAVAERLLDGGAAAGFGAGVPTAVAELDWTHKARRVAAALGQPLPAVLPAQAVAHG